MKSFDNITTFGLNGSKRGIDPPVSLPCLIVIKSLVIAWKELGVPHQVNLLTGL